MAAVQYITGRSCLAEADDFLLDTINLWLYSLVLKVLPCFVLTIITGFLIKALYKAEERSARLKVCQWLFLKQGISVGLALTLDSGL